MKSFNKINLSVALFVALMGVQLRASEDLSGQDVEALKSCAEWKVWVNSQNATPKYDMLTAMRSLGLLSQSVSLRYLSEFSSQDPAVVTYRAAFERDFFRSPLGVKRKEDVARELLSLRGVDVKCYVDPHSTHPRGSLSN